MNNITSNNINLFIFFNIKNILIIITITIIIFISLIYSKNKKFTLFKICQNHFSIKYEYFLFIAPQFINNYYIFNNNDNIKLLSKEDKKEIKEMLKNDTYLCFLLLEYIINNFINIFEDIKYPLYKIYKQDICKELKFFKSLKQNTFEQIYCIFIYYFIFLEKLIIKIIILISIFVKIIINTKLFCFITEKYKNILKKINNNILLIILQIFIIRNIFNILILLTNLSYFNNNENKYFSDTIEFNQLLAKYINVNYKNKDNIFFIIKREIKIKLKKLIINSVLCYIIYLIKKFNLLNKIFIFYQNNNLLLDIINIL